MKTCFARKHCAAAICLLHFGAVAAIVRSSHESMNKKSDLKDHAYPQYAKIDGDIEAVWQRPSTGEVKGIFFFAHGCSHQAVDLFSKIGPDGWEFGDCDNSYFGQCLALPEEMRMREHVRQRGYMIAAVSGGSGVQSCWDDGKDGPRVKKALEFIAQKENVQHVPIVAMGGSSGGHFMGELVLQGLQNLKCIVPMISRITISSEYPTNVRALFVHMSRDEGTAAGVKGNLEDLHEMNVPAEEVSIQPVAVTADFLQCEGFGLSADAATKVEAALKDNGFLTEAGLLKEDPRRSHWRSALQNIKGEVGEMGADVSKISELMNIAYAQHECIFVDRVLEFCEAA